MNYINKNMKPEGHPILVKIVFGASAYGLGKVSTIQALKNTKSKTNAHEIFKEHIKNKKVIKKNSPLFFMLGEVDCGVVMWFRKNEYKTTIKEQIVACAENYFKFLKTIKSMGYTNIYVMTPNLPTILDSYDWKDWKSDTRPKVIGWGGNQLERTKATFKFMEELEKRCKEEEFVYIDVTTPQLDEKTGVVKKNLLIKEKKWNTHIQWEPNAKIIVKKFKDMGLF